MSNVNVLHRRRALAAGVLAVLLLILEALPALGAVRTPRGYRRVSRLTLAPGVQYARFARGDRAVANAVRIEPGAPVALRTVVSKNRIWGGTERTSSMCRRTRCLVAINGDFFAKGTPVGGMVSLGELLRTPTRRRPQVLIDDSGNLEVGKLNWGGTVASTDGYTLPVDGVNVPRRAGQIILYTRRFGNSTKTRGGVELGLRIVPPAGRIRLGEDMAVRLYRVRRYHGDLSIPPRGAVLSGEGEGATTLLNLWRRYRSGRIESDLLLRLETGQDVVESLAGKGVLLRNGRLRVPSGRPSDGFSRGLHPRTVLGWNDRGDVWLVAVDGRRPGYSDGLTLRGAAVLARRLGATEAVNLDGGGSTTFVVRGRVVNRPSGGRERPVANALVLVRRKPRPQPAAEPAAPPSPSEEPAAATRSIAASTPVADRIVGPPDRPDRPIAPLAAAVAAFEVAGFALARRVGSRRRRARSTTGGGPRAGDE